MAAARQFWFKIEELIVEVAETDVEVDKSLLGQCRGLLSVCDRWVSSEEEILELNYMGAQTYILAHEKRDLHQEKYSKIVIDYKAVMKAGMTGICCNRLGAVDIGYNPIIIVL